MQIRHIFSETTTGLRRNVSMSAALIITIFISLTLFGLGLLLNSQAQRAESSWGSKLQITAFMCNKYSPPTTASPDGKTVKTNCQGAATPAQEQAVIKLLKSHPQVRSFEERSQQQNFELYKKVYLQGSNKNDVISQTVTPAAMNKTFRITLKDPQKFAGVKDALSGMDGVYKISDVREVLGALYQWINWFKGGAIVIAGFLLIAAILQVANTIRLAVYARRKEIGIMRLVGASTFYITIPFLMETLVATLIGIALAGGAIAGFMQFAVYNQLRENSRVMEWVTWGDALHAFGWITLVGLVLTLIPTLLMTRKYLKV